MTLNYQERPQEKTPDAKAARRRGLVIAWSWVTACLVLALVGNIYWASLLWILGIGYFTAAYIKVFFGPTAAELLFHSRKRESERSHRFRRLPKPDASLSSLASHFETEDFQTIGDFDEDGPRATDRVFARTSRLIKSRDGVAWVALTLYSVPWKMLFFSPRFARLRCAVCTTRFENGEILTTSWFSTRLIPPTLPWVLGEHIESQAGPRQVWKRHQERISEMRRNGLSPVPIGDIDEYLVWTKAMHERAVEYWKSIGWVNYDDIRPYLDYYTPKMRQRQLRGLVSIRKSEGHETVLPASDQIIKA